MTYPGIVTARRAAVAKVARLASVDPRACDGATLNRNAAVVAVDVSIHAPVKARHVWVKVIARNRQFRSTRL